MTGLFLLLVLGVWAWLSWWLADRLARAFALGHARMAARVALFVCLLPLPLADEIYSRPAFQRLCLANADVAVSGSKLSGRTVWFTGTTSTARKLGLLQGVELRWNFVQADRHCRRTASPRRRASVRAVGACRAWTSPGASSATGLSSSGTSRTWLSAVRT